MTSKYKFGSKEIVVSNICKWFFLKPLVKSTPLFVFLYLIYFISFHLEESMDYIWFFTKMGLFDSFVLAYIVGLFPYKLSKLVGWCVLFFCSLVAVGEFFTCHFFGTLLTPSILQLVLDTNGGETKEFFGAYCNNKYFVFLIIGWILFLGAFFVCSKWFVKILDYSKAKLENSKLSCYNNIIKVCIISTLYIIVVFCGFSCKDARPLQYKYLTANFEEEKELIQSGSRFVLNNYRPLYRFAYSLHWNLIINQCSKDALMSIKSCDIYSCNYSSPTLVLIIGESLARKHSSLYGYDKETSPYQKNMEKQGKLTLFSNIVTPYNITADIIPYIFSLNNIDDNRYWSSSIFFPYIFKNAGYVVTFLSNQFTKIQDRDVFDFSGGGFLNINSISNSLFTYRNSNKHKYDEGLLSDYDSIRNTIDHSKYNLVIFHLMGQHVMYSERYPKQWAKFTVKDYEDLNLDAKAKQIIADYDNAMLYNDHVVNQIVSRFVDKESVILYLPDHGETVYDGTNVFGRSHNIANNRLIWDNEFHISFWIWTSDKYMEKHPDIIERIKASKDCPYMSDDISQTLLDLAGINCTGFDSTRSILSIDKSKSRRRLIQGKYDYDRD